jgi:hypothetical protein
VDFLIEGLKVPVEAVIDAEVSQVREKSGHYHGFVSLCKYD